MKRIVRLTENDLSKIVKKVLLEQERGQRGDIITQDYRTVRNENSKIRRMMSPQDIQKELTKCITEGEYRKDQNRLKKECQDSIDKLSLNQWENIYYGYEGMTQQNQRSVVIAKGNLSAGDTSGTYKIIYDCNDTAPTYKKGSGTWSNNTITPQQRQRDTTWLSAWCQSINWNSRIGQDRKLFRNPRIYS